MKRKLVILVTEYSRTPEAEEIFARRGWTKVSDESIPFPKRRHVRDRKHTTPLIDLEIEEWEYGE